MRIVSNIEDWADAHHPKWLDIIRIFLGLVLVAKGISFIKSNDLMIAKLLDSYAQFPSMMLIHYIIGVQIAAGVMITFGLLTRVAAFFQIPILIAALFYLDVSQEFFVVSSELSYLILILLLLVFFFIYGSGPLSVDNYIRKHSE
jgi:uncharacterized membrane protein YphA (DoxX/SURF4 family)